MERPPTTDGLTSNPVLQRLCSSWLTRAAVRNSAYVEEPEPFFDPALYDFPPGLLPFKNHPQYLALDEPIQRRVQALAWIAWNKRVVETEECVVSRALMALLNGATDLSLKSCARTAIRQTLMDECFHSQMHEVAAGITARNRNLEPALTDRICRPAYSYRSYIAATETMSETWEKDIARLTWAIVGELSIYEFLTIVSNDPAIQPGSRTLLELHERDEAAHASVVAQVMRDHFPEFGAKQRACLTRCLPLAMNSLSQQDWLVWGDVLELAGVAGARAIIADTENDRSVPGQLPLLRSYERIEGFCQDVGIELSANGKESLHVR